MMATAEKASRYRFKPRAFSSHTLLLDLFPASGNGLRVLDVGCSEGYLSAILAARGFDVTATDFPGTPHPHGIRFVGADLDEGLPPLDELYSFILCADVLEHLRDPLRLLCQCRERLSSGGVLIASLPNSGNAYFRWTVLRGRFPQHDNGLFDRTHVRFFTWDGWMDLFDRAGFLIEEVHGSAVPVGLAVPRWDGSAFIKVIELFSFHAARIWKTLFAYQFIVRARGVRQ